jgi:hypothetical protein
MQISPFDASQHVRGWFNPAFGRENNPLLFVARLQGRMFKAGFGLQIEAMDFLKSRYVRDIAFIDDIVEAREPGDLITTCSAFALQAFEDYGREMVRAARLGQDIAGETAHDLATEIVDMAQDARDTVSRQAELAA